MMRSTLYAKCPGCSEATLILEMPGTLACARLTRKPQPESIAHVRALGERAGVKLPDAATGLPKWVVFAIIGAILLAATMLVAFASD